VRSSKASGTFCGLFTCAHEEALLQWTHCRKDIPKEQMGLEKPQRVAHFRALGTFLAKIREQGMGASRAGLSLSGWVRSIPHPSTLNWLKSSFRDCLKSLASPKTKAVEAYEGGQRGIISPRYASGFYASDTTERLLRWFLQASPSDRVDEVRGTAVGNKSRQFIFVYQYGNMGRIMSCAMASTPRSRSRRSRGHPAMERTCSGEVGIEEPRTEKIRQPKGEREDDARVSKVSKVRVLLGALVVLVLAAFAAGCGPDSDQARQEATKNIEAKGQQARQTVKKKVEAKKQEVKEKVEALQKQVDDLQKEVQVLQKKINAQEQKEQQQQINQLKKALNNLKKKVETQEQRGQ
jgi:hypothetical protein